jgi:uncharacterized membrane protein YhaH (DUF805 family)
VISLLFSFRGRINRTKYWFVTGVVTLGIFLIVLSFALAELDGVGLAPGFLLIVLLLISGLAAGVKRLHDRDKSGWWLLFYGAGSGIFQAIGDALGGQGFALAWYLLSTLLWIGMIIDLGILRGTPGPNRYGADPLREEVVLNPAVPIGGERV